MGGLIWPQIYVNTGRMKNCEEELYSFEFWAVKYDLKDMRRHRLNENEIVL